MKNINNAIDPVDFEQTIEKGNADSEIITGLMIRYVWLISMAAILNMIIIRVH